VSPIGAEKLSEETKGKLESLPEEYPSLGAVYWAREKIGGLCRQQARHETANK